MAFRYRPEIDGLRAIAVLLVVLFHADMLFPGGFVGVDVFFVISGFLITGLSLKRVEDGTWSFRDFYERRVRRILPLSTLVLVSVLVMAYWAYMPRGYMQVAKSGLWQSFFASNIYFWRHNDYFDLASHDQPFLHFWSLAVEEQFYLIFPALLIWLIKRRPNGKLIHYLSSILALSLAFSILLVMVQPRSAYFLLPSRAWELLIGAVLAVMQRDGMLAHASRRVLSAASTLGIAMLLVSSLILDLQSPFPGYNAILPTVGAGLLIWGESQGLTLVGKVLAVRPLAYIGKISFSLYLWHWPFLVLGRRVFGADATLPALVLTFIVSSLTYHLVEQPFRRRDWLKSPKRSGVFAVASVAAVAIAGMLVMQLDGIPNTAMRRSVSGDWLSSDTLADVRSRQLRRVGDLAGEGPAFAMWGDSHARCLGPALNVVGEEQGIWGYIVSSSGISTAGDHRWLHDDPEGDGNPEIDRAFLEMVEELEIPVIILAGRWGHYSEMHETGFDPVRLSHRDALAERTETELLARSISTTIQALKASGYHVIAVAQPPEWTTGITTMETETITRAAYLTGRQGYLDALKEADQLVDPMPYFFKEGRAIRRFGTRYLYADRHHISPEGALLLVDEFRQAMTHARAESPDPESAVTVTEMPE